MSDKENLFTAFWAMSTETSAVTTDFVARIICGSSATTSNTTAVHVQRNASPVDVAKFNRVSTSATRRHLISPQLTFSLRGAETTSEACRRSVPLEAIVRLARYVDSTGVNEFHFSPMLSWQ